MFQIDIEKLTIQNEEILHDCRDSFNEGIVLIVGKSGSGKTTLLRRLVPNLTKIGDCIGTVRYNGELIDDIDCGKIGYISQNPDNQLVCDKVWHELAFGLESLGVDSNVIRNRVAEMSTYFGIESLFNKKVIELSGGQKQKVCLASVMCMSPEVIVMDEPTSMLDPINAREFWDLVSRLNKELGISFVVVEHSTEYIADLATQKFYMEGGTFNYSRQVLSPIEELSEKLFGESVNSILELRSRVMGSSREVRVRQSNTIKIVRNIRHCYGNKVALNIPKIEIKSGVQCWIGPNGSGKSTLAKYLTGFFGKKILPNSVLLPQDVLTVFSKETVYEELDEVADIPEFMSSLVEHLYNKNPLDISGGEQHLVAVCKTLLKDADVYILDEPTKGIDKESISKIEKLITLVDKPIIVITHDLELVARISSYTVFLFNSEVASEGETHEVLCKNISYKSLVAKVFGNILTLEELL